MAGSWRGLTLLLLVLCCSLAAASDVDGLSQGLGSRKLLQVGTPPVATPQLPPVVTPPLPPVTPAPAARPVAPALPPVAPGRPPILAPAPAPILPPAPPVPVRTYLMWIGIGAFCLVLISVAIICLCRKFGQQKIRGAQRLPPLPRYH